MAGEHRIEAAGALAGNPDAWALLSAALGPVSPSTGGRARLLASLDGPSRYLPFSADLSRYFELPESRIRELLADVGRRDAWTPGVAPILGSLHFRPGAGLLPLHGGFVRMLGGTRLPLHRHRDREVTYVMEGALFDDQGRRFGPGQAIDMPAGSTHTLEVQADAPALVALLHGRIDFLGE